MARKRVRKGRKPPPRCKAILLCDHMLTEADTGKISIIGIFNKWTFPHFPHTTPPFKVFLQLTDGIGRYVVSVEVHDLQSDQIIAAGRVKEIDFPDRKSKVDLVISLFPLPLHHAGSYDLIVLADGQEIDRQQFQATQTTGGPPHGTEQFQGPEDH